MLLMAAERVQKILAQAGVASRRKAEELIAEGSVTINGKVAQLGDKADFGVDSIKVKGKLLHSVEAPMYLAFHKPRGVISMMADPEGRPTLSDYLKSVHTRLFPVGRLDFNSEGLIILTNDGAIAEQIQKRDDVARVYHVKIKGHPEPEKIERLAKGGRVDSKMIRLHSARIAQRLANKAVIEVVILGSGGGDLKALFELKGLLVEKIVRISLGQLTLTGIGPGEFRTLKKSQLEAVIAHPELGMRMIEEAAEKARPSEAARLVREERDSAYQDLKEKRTAFKVRTASEAGLSGAPRAPRDRDSRDESYSSAAPRGRSSGPRPASGAKRPWSDDSRGGSSDRPRGPRSDGPRPRTSGGFGDKRSSGGFGAGSRGPRSDGPRSSEGRGGFGAGARAPRSSEGRPSFGAGPRGPRSSEGRGGFAGGSRGPRSDGPRPGSGFGDKRPGGFGAAPRGPRSTEGRGGFSAGPRTSRPPEGRGGFAARNAESRGGFGGGSRGPRSDGPRPSSGFGAGSRGGPRSSEGRSSGFSDKRGGFGKPAGGASRGFGGDRPRGPRSDGPPNTGGFGDKRSGGFGDKKSSPRGPSTGDKSGPAGGPRLRRKNVY